MKVGILGSGDVGKALATGFARHGHEVMVGTRSPEKLAGWRKSVSGTVSVGSFEEAARFGEVAILAVSGQAVENVLKLAGSATFAGKLVLDATNPLDFPEDSPPGLFVGTTDSLGERVQRALPDAFVVKCFNTVPNAQMVDPNFAEGNPSMLICGNDADAKERTQALLRGIGWPGVVDVGGIDGARWLEALVPLWVRVGMAAGAWDHAFKVVR